MSAKTARQNKIKEILQTTAVSSQEELVDLLHGEGIDVTQTTLSRDFAELGIVRVHTDSGTRYVINIAESGLRTVKLLAYEILHIAHNESAVVIRTLPGRANGVAHFIDRMEKPEILGTIAGDDTVMIIPDSHANIPRVLAHIRRLTEESE
jgi:transcriptional regulator of arginine metabolism